MAGDTVTALVPLKALAAAKTRLAPALTPAARRDLAARLAASVCDACVACPAIDAVVLLAGDDDAAAVATGRSVTVWRPPACGLSAALAEADAAYADAGATLVLAADLAGVRAAELTGLITAGARGPAVVLAPTADGGTGALLRRPAGVIAPAYGPGSAAAHRAAAAAAGARLVCWWSPWLGHDVDEPADLAIAEACADSGDG
jgi:2-phospho-L-lactate guanylyltransferase